MTPAERYAAGERSKIALTELESTFAAVSSSYMARLTEIAAMEPWAADKLRSMALAKKIVDEVHQHMVAIAGGMAIAEADMQYRRKIEAMSPERRKILGIPLP